MKLGLASVAAAVLDEISVRCDTAALGGPVPIQFEIRHEAEVVNFLLTLDRQGVSVLPDWSESARVRIRAELGELVRHLFRPAAGRAPAYPEVQITWPEPVTEMAALASEMGPVLAAVHVLLTACSSIDCDLGELSIRYGSDKWGGVHWYTRHYDRHFRTLRDEPVRLLEIGVGGYDDPTAGGASLRVWQRYFRRGLIYGMDIYDKTGIDGPRIRTIQGDQSDPAFLAELAADLGPFDIVIDDGSHLNEHVLTSFDALFPHVSDGGLYVVEDVQTSYWSGYGGSRHDQNPATNTMGFLKTLVDLLHHREYEHGADALPYAAHHVAGIHFYHNLVFVEKSANNEEATPEWIPRSLFAGKV